MYEFYQAFHRVAVIEGLGTRLNKATTNPPSLTPRSLQPHSQITPTFTPRPLVVHTETCRVCGVVVSTHLSVFQVNFVSQHYEWEVFRVTRASLDEKLVSPAV